MAKSAKDSTSGITISGTAISTIINQMCPERDIDVVVNLGRETVRNIFEAIVAAANVETKQRMMTELEALYQQQYQSMYTERQQRYLQIELGDEKFQKIFTDKSKYRIFLASEWDDYSAPAEEIKSEICQEICKMLFVHVEILGNSPELAEVVFDFLRNHHVVRTSLLWEHDGDRKCGVDCDELLLNIAFDHVLNDDVEEKLKSNGYRVLTDIFSNLKTENNITDLWSVLEENQCDLLRGFVQSEPRILTVDWMMTIFKTQYPPITKNPDDKELGTTHCLLSILHTLFSTNMKLEFVFNIFDELSKLRNGTENAQKIAKEMYTRLHARGRERKTYAESFTLYCDILTDDQIQKSRIPVTKIQFNQKELYCNHLDMKLLNVFQRHDMIGGLKDEEVCAIVDFFVSHIVLCSQDILKLTKDTFMGKGMAAIASYGSKCEILTETCARVMSDELLIVMLQFLYGEYVTDSNIFPPTPQIVWQPFSHRKRALDTSVDANEPGNEPLQKK